MRRIFKDKTGRGSRNVHLKVASHPDMAKRREKEHVHHTPKANITSKEKRKAREKEPTNEETQAYRARIEGRKNALRQEFRSGGRTFKEIYQDVKALDAGLEEARKRKRSQSP
ncbi:hypothetical protein BC830DRAFT_1083832 [Chytriomyces sp. MP71]|nr:hypothetical protein BC830DRAFT_1083832 [Chytriomyces sp. MP71]